VKVIFIEDVQNVARAGQTKEVAGGYARNYLFPKKFAVLANSQAAASVDAHLKKIAKARAIEEAEMAAVARKISGLEITLRAKVGENDKLYGSITGADIAEALSKSAGCVIDKKVIVMPEPIKQTGVCDVTVRFTHDITAVIKVNVISEDATEEKPAKPAKTEKKEEKAEAAVEEKPAKEKKAKAPKAEKAEAPAEEKPAKEKKAKAPKAEKVAEEKAEAVAEEKPAKEKKAKAPKAEKAEAPAEEKPAEEKKEKKPRAKAKKTED
jgi:large subunit ribosomal protein L9